MFDNLVADGTNGIQRPIQYKLNIEKIFKSEDVNKKLNLLLKIFDCVNITLEKYVIDDEIREFVIKM